MKIKKDGEYKTSKILYKCILFLKPSAIYANIRVTAFRKAPFIGCFELSGIVAGALQTIPLMYSYKKPGRVTFGANFEINSLQSTCHGNIY